MNSSVPTFLSVPTCLSEAQDLLPDGQPLLVASAAGALPLSSLSPSSPVILERSEGSVPRGYGFFATAQNGRVAAQSDMCISQRSGRVGLTRVP